MSSRPEISVIITAFERREFIAEALDSVAGQDLDPSRFEVVLCTNFSTANIESGHRRSPVIRLEMPSGTWGEWVLAALPRCQGDVLCFLDDDDLFERNKLSSIRSVFRQLPSVGYYHNRVQRFADGAPSSRGRHPGFRRGPEGPGYGLVADGQKSRTLVDRLFWGEGGFNASAMAVRREVLTSLGSLTSDLEVGHSLALFYAAVVGPWDLYFDPAPLTRYRVHAANSSVPIGTGLRRGVRGTTDHGQAVIRDSERIAGFVESHRQGRFSSAPIRSVGVRTRLLQSFGLPTLTRTELLRGLAEYLSLTPARIVADQRGLLAMIAFGLLSPRLPERWLRSRAIG